jgi:signal transduction histidine kinase
LKHSAATTVTVDVVITEPTVGAPTVTATVTDNGCGFHPERVPTYDGHGLRGMDERLAAFGGRLEVRSSPGRGTTVVAELPGDLEE